MADSVDLGKCFEIINNLVTEAGRVSLLPRLDWKIIKGRSFHLVDCAKQ